MNLLDTLQSRTIKPIGATVIRFGEPLQTSRYYRRLAADPTLAERLRVRAREWSRDNMALRVKRQRDRRAKERNA